MRSLFALLLSLGACGSTSPSEPTSPPRVCPATQECTETNIPVCSKDGRAVLSCKDDDKDGCVEESKVLCGGPDSCGSNEMGSAKCKPKQEADGSAAAMFTPGFLVPGEKLPGGFEAFHQEKNARLLGEQSTDRIHMVLRSYAVDPKGDAVTVELSDEKGAIARETVESIEWQEHTDGFFYVTVPVSLRQLQKSARLHFKMMIKTTQIELSLSGEGSVELR